MKKRLAVLGLSLCLVTSMFTGCGEKKVTVRDVLEGMNNYSDELKSAAMDMKVEVDADVVISDVPLNVNANIDYDMAMEMENATDVDMHMDVTMAYSVLGQSMNQTMEMYMDTNDGEVSTYMKMASLGSDWYKASSPIDADQMSKLMEVSKEKKEITDDNPMLNADLSKEKYNDVACYKLTYKDSLGSFSQQINESLAAAGINIEELAAKEGLNIDFDAILNDLKFEIVVYAAQDDFRPVFMSLDMADTSVEDLLKDCGVDISALAGQMGAKLTGIELNKLAVEVEINDINGTTVDVPADVEASAVDVNGMEY